MNNIMNIFDVGLDGWNIIYVRFNWVAVIVLIIAFLILSFILKRVVNIAKVNSNPRIPFVTQESLFVNENPVL